MQIAAAMFPSELERLIFEEAAVNDKQTALRLALVSRQVQAWVEPILYQILTLYYPNIKGAFLRSLEITTKPSSFYTQYIKAVFLPCYIFQEQVQNTDDAIKLLPYCKGVKHFVCWISPESVDTRLADVITVMRPKRLVARLTNLLGTLQPNFSLPFFDNVTHLEITDPTEWTTWSGIHRLPRLSHILLHVDANFTAVAATSDAVQVVNDLLSHCKTLQVCVISHDDMDPALNALELIDDVRLVFILTPDDIALDWHSFVKGKPDTWVYAEEAVVRQRQIGRVKACPVYTEYVSCGRMSYGNGRVTDWD